MTALITKSFKLSKHLAIALAREAKEQGVTESELIRRGLESMLNNEDGIDMVKALGKGIGCVRGPGDLSWNKKYMEGYGRSRNR